MGYEHDDDNEWTKFEDILGCLKKFIDQGKIKHVGLSNETSWGLSKFLELSITELDGMRDKEKISTIIPSMPIRDSQELRKYITKTEPGLDLDIPVKTPSGSVVNTKLQFGTAFFRPFFGL